MSDLFKAEKLASQFCDQYEYKRGTKEYEIAVNAFCVGFRMKQGAEERRNYD